MINYLLIYSDWGVLALRVVLGVLLMAHGWPKIKNIRGTAGWLGPMGFRPATFWAAVVSLLEFVGGAFLVVGFFTQIVAALVAIQFLIIILKINAKKGLVGGYEFDLLILGASLALLTLSGGSMSLDNILGLRLY